MKYLESFNTFVEEDTIQIREISSNEVFNIVINEINHPGLPDRKTASEIYCNDARHLGLKYKNCECSKTDSNYLKHRIKREFYNVNGEYASIKGKKFKIQPTTHFLERLYRKSDPYYKDVPEIINPTIDEGLDLIFNNFDRVLKFITDRRGNPKVSLELINNKATDSWGYIMPYSIILAINKINGVYIITLITHIKGVPMYSGKYTTQEEIIEKISFEKYTKKLKTISKYLDSNLLECLCLLLDIDLKSV